MNKKYITDLIGIIVIFIVMTMVFRGDNFEVYKFCISTISTWIVFINRHTTRFVIGEKANKNKRNV
jgi:positive regulator of sigma E activity